MPFKPSYNFWFVMMWLKISSPACPDVPVPPDGVTGVPVVDGGDDGGGKAGDVAGGCDGGAVTGVVTGLVG